MRRLTVFTSEARLFGERASKTVKMRIFSRNLVEQQGFKPWTSALQRQRSNQLSYCLMFFKCSTRRELCKVNLDFWDFWGWGFVVWRGVKVGQKRSHRLFWAVTCRSYMLE